MPHEPSERSSAVSTYHDTSRHGGRHGRRRGTQDIDGTPNQQAEDSQRHERLQHQQSLDGSAQRRGVGGAKRRGEAEGNEQVVRRLMPLRPVRQEQAPRRLPADLPASRATTHHHLVHATLSVNGVGYTCCDTHRIRRRWPPAQLASGLGAAGSGVAGRRQSALSSAPLVSWRCSSRVSA